MEEPGAGPGAVPSINGICDPTPRICHFSFSRSAWHVGSQHDEMALLLYANLAFLSPRIGAQGELRHGLRD